MKSIKSIKKLRLALITLFQLFFLLLTYRYFDISSRRDNFAPQNIDMLHVERPHICLPILELWYLSLEIRKGLPVKLIITQQFMNLCRCLFHNPFSCLAHHTVAKWDFNQLHIATTPRDFHFNKYLQKVIVSNYEVN